MFLETALFLGGISGACYFAIKRFWPWLLLDIRYLARVIPTVVRYIMLQKNRTFVIDLFEAAVKRTPDKQFLLFEDQVYTYKEADEYATKMARVIQSLGIQRGSTIAYMHHNSPDFVWMFLGCLKLDVTMSLINTNLRGKALLHCLKVSDTNIIITGTASDLISAVGGVISELPDATVYVQGSNVSPLPSRFISLGSKIEDDTQVIDADARADQKDTDPCVYVFTSGTTGMPKAASVPHRKLLACVVLSGCVGLRTDDVVYITMPMYHSAALIAAFCGSVCQGATVALARKFSKNNFWEDVRRHRATVFCYIGELCRYLLTNEKTDQDKDHHIRLAFGNGLRQDIFAKFQTRFGVPNIAEFYGSTEGVAGFANVFNVTGSCGRSSPLLERLIPCGLFQWDVQNEALIRNDKGHCIPVKSGTPGLLLMQIIREQKFDGYRGSKELSEKKIVRNVRHDGDMFFNTGDLLYKDSDYNLYFSDRLGDTFRWKGENVSTTEVSNLLTDLDFIIDACVYGVIVPGYDGRAGMATLLVQNEVEKIPESELSALASHCRRVLPVYAIPMFLRIKWEELVMTSTIKQSKVRLKQEGFDMSAVKDPMFYFDKSTETYKRLTLTRYEQIMNGTVRF